MCVFFIETFNFLFAQDNLKFVGHDINVTGVWENHITGKGVTVSVIDDGKSMYILYKNTTILFQYNNRPVVTSVNKRSVADPGLGKNIKI